MAKIKLKDIRSSFEGFSRLADLAAQTKDSSFENIEVDMSDTNWFDANMSAPLGVILSRLTDGLNTVTPIAKGGVQKILSKNQFLVGFGYPEEIDTYGTTIPYRRFKPDDERYFAVYINKYLTGKGIPSMSEGLERRFKDSILEIFMNCAMHSETKLGIFACGQYYPKDHRLDFSIADAGIGIRRKIARELGLNLNSDKAILWALQEGHTTRKGDVPGGLGLKLLREFVAKNHGRLQIVSDRGYWECDGDDEKAARFDHSFPGTVVNLEINTADTQSYRLRSEN